jgi:hypothetical protein
VLLLFSQFRFIELYDGVLVIGRLSARTFRHLKGLLQAAIYFNASPANMDPLSVSAAAAELLTICVQAVQIMKRTIETLRNAKEFLLMLLSQTERLRLFLEQLRGLTKQLGHRSGILLAYNDSGPRATINELNNFVRDMAQRTTWVRLRVLLHQNAADKLVERLHRHEEEIMQVLLSIAT